MESMPSTPRHDPGMQDRFLVYEAQIQKLKAELAARQEEKEQIIAENLRQNEMLCQLNQNLENKVKQRTLELEESKAHLEVQAQPLRELDQCKDAFMHMIMHDMKNPLTAILGTLSMFKSDSMVYTPEVRGLLLDAHQHGRKLLGMIEEILAISRMQSREFTLRRKEVNLVLLLQSCMDTMNKTLDQQHLKMKFNPERTEVPAIIDSAIVERVVNNLLNNAIKYAPPGSEILLSMELRADEVVISVTNWGKPIPAEFHQRMFDMFYRLPSAETEFSGTGLGLTFVKLAVEAHGGRMGVESPVSPRLYGARFWFSLPHSVLSA